MKIYSSKSRDPYFNTSLEEIILKNCVGKEDVIMFYQNDNAIIIGKNQNAFQEINEEFCKEHKIKITRRISGGGAVYHDEGNINFSFMTSKANDSSYQKFLEPVFNFLKELGLNAEFKGRNDVVIDGKKISGNAQYKFGNKMFHHGTLLFDANLAILGSALKPNKLKMESKGIKSARQRVLNIRDALKKDMTAPEFLNKMVQFFEKQNATHLEVGDEIISQAKELAKERSKWEWIYGKSPKFKIVHEAKLDGGVLSTSLNAVDGKITNIKFQGDFLSKKDVGEIEKKLINVEFNNKKINKVLSKFVIEDYFGSIKQGDILRMILGETV